MNLSRSKGTGVSLSAKGFGSTQESEYSTRGIRYHSGIINRKITKPFAFSRVIISRSKIINATKLHLHFLNLSLHPHYTDDRFMKNHFFGLHLDFIGFGTSILCAIHCATLPFLLTFAPLAGLQFLDNPWIEYSIILLSLLIAINSLMGSYSRHHQKLAALVLAVIGFVFIGFGQLLELEWTEVLLTAAGGVMIAIAHLVNWKLIRQSSVNNHNNPHH